MTTDLRACECCKVCPCTCDVWKAQHPKSHVVPAAAPAHTHTCHISVVQRLCCLQLPSCEQPFSISRNSDPSCLPVAISAKHPCLSPPSEGSFSACLFLVPCPAPPCLPWNFFLVSSFALCISHLIHLTTYDL